MSQSTGLSISLSMVFLVNFFNLYSQISSTEQSFADSATSNVVSGANNHTPKIVLSKSILIELALFVDQSLNQHFKHNLMLNETEIEDLLQGYVSQVDFVFSSLRSRSISRIHIHSLATRFLETHSVSENFSDGDIDNLLSNFCHYQNEERELAPVKWDLALLLTSLDLYSGEEVRTSSRAASSTTMGISFVHGINRPGSSCSLVEFGVGYDEKQLSDTIDGRVYPSRGIASAWVAAHEIAHSLGIYHDGPPFNDDCDPGKWIMSQSSYIGSMNTRWSACSVESLEQLDLSKFAVENFTLARKYPLPGEKFDAEFQCRMFSPDLHKVPTGKGSQCNDTLMCISPQNRLVPIGLALAGTRC